jgi:RHS repeat-associated protein
MLGFTQRDDWAQGVCVCVCVDLCWVLYPIEGVGVFQKFKRVKGSSVVAVATVVLGSLFATIPGTQTAGAVAPVGACVSGDAGGVTIFGDAHAPGWVDVSWADPAVATAGVGVGGSAGLKTSGALAQWGAVALRSTAGNTGADVVSFTVKGSGSWRVEGVENGVEKGQAPFTATSSWQTFTCRFPGWLTAGPVDVVFKNVGGNGQEIVLDDIRLSNSSAPSTTSTSTTTSLPVSSAGSVAAVGSCAAGDMGGDTVFGDSLASGWADISWPAAASPVTGVSGTGLQGTKNRYEALALRKAAGNTGADVVSFAVTGAGSWRVEGIENGTVKGTAPFTATSSWQTMNCRFPGWLTAGPVDLVFKSLDQGAHTITLDNIKLINSGSISTTATTTPATIPGAQGAPAGTCVSGDAGGITVFGDTYAAGWSDASWGAQVTVTADGVNSSGGLKATLAPYQAIALRTETVSVDADVITFSVKGAGTWEVGFDSGGVQRSAPFTATTTWQTFNCRWQSALSGTPAWFAFKNVGSSATISIDNIKLSKSTTPTTTTAPPVINSLPGDPPAIGAQAATRGGRGSSSVSLAVPFTPTAATNTRSQQAVIQVPSDSPLRDPISGTTAAPGNVAAGPTTQVQPTVDRLLMFFEGANNLPNVGFPSVVWGTGHKQGWTNAPAYNFDSGARFAAVSNMDFSAFSLGSGQAIQKAVLKMSLNCQQQRSVQYESYWRETNNVGLSQFELIRFPGKTAAGLTKDDYYLNDPVGSGNAKWSLNGPPVGPPNSLEFDITDWATQISASGQKVQNPIVMLMTGLASGLRCDVLTQDMVLTLANAPRSVQHLSPLPGALTTNTPTLSVALSVPYGYVGEPLLSYQFNVCQDVAMTIDCRSFASTAPAGANPSVTLPADGVNALHWNATYFWSATIVYNSAVAPFTALKTSTAPSPLTTSSKEWSSDPLVSVDLASAGWSPFVSFDGADDGSFGINSGTGALIHSESDAMISTAGPSLAVLRTYNSNDQRVGLFGKGWSSLFDSEVKLVSSGETPVTITNARGAVVVYPDGRREFHGRNPSVGGIATWGDQKGFNARLSQIAASNSFELKLRNGTVMTFSQLSASSSYTIAQIRDANNRALQFTRPDAASYQVLDPLSSRAVLATVSGGRITSIALRKDTATTDSTWTYFYVNGELQKVCRPETGAPPVCAGTTYTYLGGRLASLKRPSGTELMSVDYNADGSVKSRTDSGVTTTYTYEKLDSNGLAVAVADEYRTTTNLPLLPGTTAAQRKRVESYDSQRRLIKTISPGQTTESEKRSYDESGFLAYVENELGQRVTYENDSRGNVRRMWDPLSRVTAMEYTSPVSPDLVTKRTHPTGLFEQWTYDAYRNMLTAKGTAGVTTTNTYYTDALAVPPNNNFGLLRTTSTPTVGTTTFTYTGQHDLFTEVSPRGLRKEYGYDGVGRLTTTKTGTATQTALYGTETISSYDLAGRVKVMVSPDVTNAVTGEVTRLQSVFTYTPDFNGNLANVVATTIHVSGPNPPVPAPARTVIHTYDAYDRHKSTSDGFTISQTNYDPVSGVVVSSRDTSNRLTRTDTFYPIGTPKQGSVVTAAGVARIVQTVNAIDALGRPLQTTDLQGRVNTIDYAADGQIARVRLTSGATTYLVSQSSFDAAGRIVRSYADDGLTEVVTGYDVNGRVGTISKVMGGFGANSAPDRTTAITYVASGFGTGEVFTTTDPTGGVTTMTYQAGGVIASVAAPAGTSSFTYDERGLQKTATDVTGAVTTTNYDLFGRATSTVLPAVAVNGGPLDSPVPKTGLNLFGEATETQDANGNVTRHEFNEFGHHKKVTYPTYTPPGGTAISPTEAYTYETGTALLSSVTGRNGGVTNYTYDPWADRTQKVTSPDGTFTQYQYDDPANTVTTQTGGGGTVLQTTVAKLDAHNRPFETIQSAVGELNRVTKSEFDGAGRVLRSVDALSFVYANAFDRAGGLLETTAPDGTAVSTTVFDGLGRVDTSTDALGRVRKVNYRADQRVDSVQSKSVAGVVMESVTYGYNIAGRSTTTTNLRGDTTIEFGNALGQTVEARQNLTSTADYMSTVYGYDLAGNLTGLTDGRGKLTTYTYNPWNLRETLVEPGAEPVADRTWTTSYNLAGLPVKDVEPGGTQTVRTFDSMDRLKTVTGTDPDATLNASKSFGYDQYGRLNSFGSPDGARTVTYNGFGQLATVNNGSAFAYDQRGLMSTRSDAAGTSSFGWTSKGELETQTIGTLGQVKHVWAGGELRTTQFNTAAGATTNTKRSYGYDGIGRLTADLVTKDAVPVSWSAYSYDKAGNVLSQQYGLPGNPGAGVHLYDYDNAGRLTGWTKPGTSVPVVFGYDKAGNRTTAAGITYIFDDRNRLTNSTDGASFTYSKRGTLASETRAGVTTNSWSDALGRVVQTGANVYSYDDFDRIIQRTGTSIDPPRGAAPQAPGVTTVAGATTSAVVTTVPSTTVVAPTTVGSPATTTPRQAAPQAAVAPTFSYAGFETQPVSDKGQSFVRSPSGRPVAVTSNTSTSNTDGFRWVGTNRHGDVTQLLDPLQANPLTGTQSFDPFGQPLSAAIVRIGYQGNWTEPDTQQPWMAARWYQPRTASFTTRDTLLGDVGGPAVGHNRYSYAGNNPLTYWDPTGRFMEGVCIACVAIALAGELENAYNMDDPSLISDATYKNLHGMYELTAGIPSADDPYAPVKAVNRAGSSVYRVPLRVLVMHHFGWSLDDLRERMLGSSMEAYLMSARTGLNSVALSLKFGNGWGIQTADAPLESFWAPLFNCSRADRDARHQDCVQASKSKSGLEEATALWLIDYGLTKGDFKRVSGMGGNDGVYPSQLVGENGVWNGKVCPSGGLGSAIPANCLANFVAGNNQAYEFVLLTQTLEAATARKATKTPCHSFRYDTTVLMADGTRKRIAEVGVGDRVLTTDPETGERVIREVTELHVNFDMDMANVSVRDADGNVSTIYTTQTHQFWSPTDNRWEDAADLDEGELLRTFDGSKVTVIGVRTWDGYQTMYDLTVEGVHTYYVTAGNEGVLVHNCNGTMRATTTPEKPTTPPGWVKQGGHYAEVTDANPAAAARRIMDEQYGPGNWSGKGGGSELSQLQKWLSRYFVWS